MYDALGTYARNVRPEATCLCQWGPLSTESARRGHVRFCNPRPSGSENSVAGFVQQELRANTTLSRHEQDSTLHLLIELSPGADKSGSSPALHDPGPEYSSFSETLKNRSRFS
ncbi:hypothetical protein J6590_015436 [Homalodisca vitripennis]|nr:hypothetical protein J6590_015436 [Homalodisca vitripennis]